MEQTDITKVLKQAKKDALRASMGTFAATLFYVIQATFQSGVNIDVLIGYLVAAVVGSAMATSLYFRLKKSLNELWHEMAFHSGQILQGSINSMNGLLLNILTELYILKKVLKASERFEIFEGEA